MGSTEAGQARVGGAGGGVVVLGGPAPSGPLFPKRPHGPCGAPINKRVGRCPKGCGSLGRVGLFSGVYIPTVLHALTAGHPVDVIAALPGGV